MAELTNVTEVRLALDRIGRKYRDASVIVGYTAAYALWVHENVEMKWRGLPRKEPHKGHYWDPPGRGQSKFLEQPARTEAKTIAAIILKGLNEGLSFGQALLRGGRWLQRCSMLLCPVDFGNLKNSAFTELEQ